MTTPDARELQRLTRPSPGIQSDHPRVTALAAELCAGLDDPLDKARALFEFSRDHIRYDIFQGYGCLEDYLASNVLQKGKGLCVQKAALLCALGRAAGIPARLGLADIENHRLPDELAAALGTRVLACHAFTELFLEGRWVKLTPAFDSGLCLEKGWKVVQFQGLEDALLPESDLAGHPHITYVRYLGTREEVPVEELLAAWRKIYGQARMDHFDRVLIKAGGSQAK